MHTMDLEESRLSLIIALFVALSALILQIVGVATPYWISVDTQNHAGLWEVCVLAGCDNYFDGPGWLKAVRGLEVSGILLISLSLITTALSIFWHADSSNLKRLKIASTFASFLASILIIVGVIIYISKNDANYLSWSLGICIGSGVISVVCGVFVLVSCRAEECCRLGFR